MYVFSRRFVCNIKILTEIFSLPSHLSASSAKLVHTSHLHHSIEIWVEHTPVHSVFGIDNQMIFSFMLIQKWQLAFLFECRRGTARVTEFLSSFWAINCTFRCQLHIRLGSFLMSAAVVWAKAPIPSVSSFVNVVAPSARHRCRCFSAALSGLPLRLFLLRVHQETAAVDIAPWLFLSYAGNNPRHRFQVRRLKFPPHSIHV